MKNPGSFTVDTGGGRLKAKRSELKTGNPYGLINPVPWYHGVDKIAESEAIEHPVI
jgi:hypothetical protein